MEQSEYDQVSIRFYWNNPMTIDQMTELVYNFLEELESKFPVLSGWCNLGKSRKDALNKKFEVSQPYIKKKLLRSYQKEMDEGGYSGLGYRISLYNEDKDEKPMSLDIYTNDLQGLFTANCIFEYENTDLFDKDTLLNLLRYMIRHFKADYGCVQTTRLESIKTGSNVGWLGNHYGWVSYTHKKDLNLGDNYIIEQDNTGGCLIYLNHAEKFYDYDRVKEIFALEGILKIE